MKKITPQTQAGFYWWLDAEYNHGDFSEPKFALHAMDRDVDGCKDDDTDEIVMWAAYADVPGYAEAADDALAQYSAVNAYIMNTLGFLPDYDVN